MPEIPVFDHDAVLAAVDPATAIDAVRNGFVRYHRGEWVMPPKVYLESPPWGDFRAMPALGDGVALLKWITSFPGNPARGLPTVSGVICLSDAETGVPLALIDARAVTALRTGAVAAVSAVALASGSTVGLVGCGLHGRWAARAMSAAGYAPGVGYDPSEAAVSALVAFAPGWRGGSLKEALSADIVVTMTPGSTAIIEAGSLKAGQHLALMGADGPGKSEATVAAVASCALFCDEWAQAAHGGELTGAVEAGIITRDRVTDLGAVLAGDAPGRPGPEAVTLFDSTGLAIQDLAVALAVLDAWKAGRVTGHPVTL